MCLILICQMLEMLLLQKKQSGISVRVGIDLAVINARPEVKAIYESLLAAGIQVNAVDSVGLNHQKIAARDWSTPDASVLLSSGNLTQSCIGPEGDLKGKEALIVNSEDLKYSIPNANHAIQIRSKLLAQMVLNELTKTIDLKLRGNEYPQSGIYRVFARGGARANAPSITIAFSPRGGFGDLNRDFIKQVIDSTSGPVKTLQFAFSSKVIEESLFARAQRERDSPVAIRLARIHLKVFLRRAVGGAREHFSRDWQMFKRFKSCLRMIQMPFRTEARLRGILVTVVGER